MMIQNGYIMKIECPHCHTSNKIEYAENISCKKCEKNFKGFKFSQKKLISTSAALAFGVFGGYKVNGALVDERYPLEVEYAIVDTCINSANNILSYSRYENKRKTCLCALEKTEKSFAYSDYKSDHTLFLSKFRQNARACSV